MLKRKLNYVFSICLIIISCFYTSSTIKFIRNYDPIMKEILENKDNYYVSSIEPIINDTLYIPGINGLEVDVDKSYLNMKGKGIYDESLLVFSEVETITKDDYSIISGNESKKMVSLIIKLTNKTQVDSLLELLSNKDIQVDFIIDKQIETVELINKIKSYNHNILTSNKDEFSSLTYYSDNKYCIFEDYSNEYLYVCNKNNYISVIPSIIVNSSLYSTIKNNLKYGNIIFVNSNIDSDELSITLDYIKQKGIKIQLLDNHLSTSNN